MPIDPSGTCNRICRLRPQPSLPAPPWPTSPVATPVVISAAVAPLPALDSIDSASRFGSASAASRRAAIAAALHLSKDGILAPDRPPSSAACSQLVTRGSSPTWIWRTLSPTCEEVRRQRQGGS
ncbi:hypothetical protein Vafri_1402 [Volvox africanus]|nr:hypothetical protein Vafri_1402 [Volvox africanus]